MSEEAKEQAAEEEPRRVQADNLGKYIGEYTTLWRDKKRQVAQIESQDREAKKITYKLMTGPDKGIRLQSRYDSSQTIFVYDEKQLVLAVLNT